MCTASCGQLSLSPSGARAVQMSSSRVNSRLRVRGDHISGVRLHSILRTRANCFEMQKLLYLTLKFSWQM